MKQQEGFSRKFTVSLASLFACDWLLFWGERSVSQKCTAKSCNDLVRYLICLLVIRRIFRISLSSWSALAEYVSGGFLLFQISLSPRFWSFGNTYYNLSAFNLQRTWEFFFFLKIKIIKRKKKPRNSIFVVKFFKL